MAIILYAISFPIACFSEFINVFPEYYSKDGVIFQKILMYFGLLPPIKAALAAFFVGQGRTKIITISVVSGTLLLVILDYFLIYEYNMGAKGSAIATIIAEVVEIAIYASIFFSPKNRKFYNTFKGRKFNKDLFCKCLKVGTPMAFGNFVALLAWYVIQTAIAHTSKDAATNYNIGINIYIFFIFVGEGMNKGIASICSNFIGQNNLKAIEKTRKIGVKIALILGIIVAIPLIGFPEWIMNTLDILSENILKLHNQIKIVLFIISISVTLETLVLSTWGILIAGGDTRYAMIICQLFLWTLVVLPTTVLYFCNKLTSIPLVYSFMIAWLIATQFFIYKMIQKSKVV